MMGRRQALLDGRIRRGAGSNGSLPLGSAGQLRSRLPRIVEADGLRYRLVEVEGEILAHSTVCPHLGGPLDAGPVVYGCVTCPWHGYRFHLRSGKNVDGHPFGLPPGPRVEVVGGEARLVWDGRP